MQNTICNALSVDVEDYYHVTAFAEQVRPSTWDSYTPRVSTNTFRLLELFEKRDVKGTFFVLGWVGERHREVVKAIHQAGHEVACHGFSHRLIYDQSADEFRCETRRAKQLLEDIIGEEVYGYRAASFSIVPSSRWALDVLLEEGFLYDSSIYPIQHDRYGMPQAMLEPHLLTTLNGGSIAEFPPTALHLFGARVPVGGGGYFRLYPYWLTRTMLRHVNRQGRPFMSYVHPWEIDPMQPRIGGSAISRFRHYVNLGYTEMRLARLVTEFRMAPIREVLGELQLLPLSGLADKKRSRNSI